MGHRGGGSRVMSTWFYSSALIAAKWARIIKLKKQNLIFGIIYIGNVKVVPTFRINFSNFPWQLLDAYRPAGCACPMQPAPACVGQL
jgi:hypothetical protein